MHTVLAHNDAVAAENKIHDDDVARQYGFSGGLVPGVTVFAYLVHAPVERWGLPWLSRGTLSARFVQPVYEGDRVQIRATGDADLDLELLGPSGVCGTGVAALPSAPLPVPDVRAFPSGPLPRPDQRLPASAEVLSSMTLGSVEATWHAERAGEYLEAIGEDAAVFRDERVAHPGWLLRPANYVLSQNVKLGPWIHVSSGVTLHDVVRDGDVVSTRGRVASVFERKGHRFVELDVVMVVGERAVMSVRHVAIYEPRPVTSPSP